MRLPTRRAVMTGLVAGAALGGCAPPPLAVADGVLAAGQPAAVLVWSLAPERLLGWPRRPLAEGLAALPDAAAALPQLGALTGGGGPADLEAMAALRPALVLDYGDADPAYVALGQRLEARLGAPWRLIDGALIRTPDALLQAGAALNVGERSRLLADRAEVILSRWSGLGNGPTFYYARGTDGLETAFAGSLNTEVFEGAGWTNLATGGRDVGPVAREQIVAWDPEVIVTLSPAFARTAADDPLWRTRRDGKRRRLLLLPEAPFGWIDRPPSINRLIGCDWLSGGPFAADPAESSARALELMALLFGPASRLAAVPLPRWIV